VAEAAHGFLPFLGGAGFTSREMVPSPSVSNSANSSYSSLNSRFSSLLMISLKLTLPSFFFGSGLFIINTQFKNWAIHRALSSKDIHRYVNEALYPFS
jgi:hypothetical protein